MELDVHAALGKDLAVARELGRGVWALEDVLDGIQLLDAAFAWPSIAHEENIAQQFLLTLLQEMLQLELERRELAAIRRTGHLELRQQLLKDRTQRKVPRNPRRLVRCPAAVGVENRPLVGRDECLEDSGVVCHSLCGVVRTFRIPPTACEVLPLDEVPDDGVPGWLQVLVQQERAFPLLQRLALQLVIL